MHDKRIVHINPEGQFNTVFWHAQINPFKLLHKQPKLQDRKKNCYLGFSEDTLPEGKNLQYFILDQPVVSNRIRDIWHLVLVNWYGSYFHSTTVVWWTIFLLVHPPRKYDICRWSWQEWWTGLFRLFWCLSAQKVVYGGHASNHFFWYFAWALIKVIFQSAGQRTTPRIR